MALYAYSCERCGEFEEVRPMAEAGEPAHCPRCRNPARRVFTPPLTRRMDAGARAALGREERSRHEPARVAAPAGNPLPHRHQGPGQPWAVSH